MIELDCAEFVADTATGSARVLHPVSLRLSEHRIALIGANGSGKSTLARLLNGLIEPTGGAVRVAADDAGQESGRGSAPHAHGSTPSPAKPHWHDTVRDGAAVRRLVGFVFTDPAAQLVMPTAVEDVALSLRRSHPSKRDRLTAARDALAGFGLDQLAERSVHTLSGGQRQMLALASVLAAQPRILVADEPTTLLDLRNSRAIAEQLLALPQQLVIATHDLELAARCDRVIVIADGAVARDSAEPVGADFDSVRQGGDTTSATRAAIAWYRESVGA